MNKLYSLLTIALLIPCFIFITSCSDDKNTGEPINQTSLTPIEKNKIDTYAGTYKGTALSFDGLSTSDGRQILNFGAQIHLSKQDDNNLAFNYIIQYSGYNQPNTVARDDKLTKLPVTDINYISQDTISFNIKNGTKTYNVTLTKENDKIDNILPDTLWQAKPLCNATNQAIAGVDKCTDVSITGAYTLIAGYRIQDITFEGCDVPLIGGKDLVGELTADPFMQDGVHLPITLKLQVENSWLTQNAAKCGIQNNGSNFYFKKLENNIVLDNNLDLSSIFTDVGIKPNATKYSPSVLSFNPQEQDPKTLLFTDLIIWGKKATIILEVIESGGTSKIFTGGGAVKTLTNTPYWK